MILHDGSKTAAQNKNGKKIHVQLGHAWYIEVAPSFVLLCGINGLRGFQRNGGKRIIQISPKYRIGKWRIDVNAEIVRWGHGGGINVTKNHSRKSPQLESAGIREEMMYTAGGS